MKIHASGEDYLEAVLILQKKQGMVRSVDLARHMGFSKPSISHAVGILKNGGFLTVDEDGFLHLTAMFSIQQKKAKSSVIIRLRRFLQKAEHQSRKRRH